MYHNRFNTTIYNKRGEDITSKQIDLMTEICPECNGLGYHERDDLKIAVYNYRKKLIELDQPVSGLLPVVNQNTQFRCNKCCGIGKVDWIEKIVNSKKLDDRCCKLSIWDSYHKKTHIRYIERWYLASLLYNPNLIINASKGGIITESDYYISEDDIDEYLDIVDCMEIDENKLLKISTTLNNIDFFESNFIDFIDIWSISYRLMMDLFNEGKYCCSCYKFYIEPNVDKNILNTNYKKLKKENPKFTICDNCLKNICNINQIFIDHEFDTDDDYNMINDYLGDQVMDNGFEFMINYYNDNNKDIYNQLTRLSEHTLYH